MGEKGDEKPKKADGEKKKDGGGGATAGDKKKDDGPTTVVLKVDMHCEGCALKVKRSVKGFEGVEAVATDLESNKLTVVGKVDPVELRERVEVKTRKKVELISPINASKAKNGGGGGGDAKKPAAAGGGENKDQKKPTGDQKPKQPQVSTIVLKIRLHCEGCTQRIVKTIRKVKGVDNVLVESGKDLVTVKGTMNTKTLPTLLKEKLKRGIEVVPPKKEDGGGGGDNKKEGGGGGGGGEKKKKEGGSGGGGGGEKKKESGNEKEEGKGTTGMGVATMNKMEYYGPYGPYRMEMAHAPQMFSDENPNACSIM